MTKLTFKEVISFLSLMKQRIVDIEDVINSHFDLVKKVILKDKSDKLYRAMKRDQQEQRKMAGGGGKTSRTGGTTRKSTGN